MFDALRGDSIFASASGNPANAAYGSGFSKHGAKMAGVRRSKQASLSSNSQRCVNSMGTLSSQCPPASRMDSRSFGTSPTRTRRTLAPFDSVQPRTYKSAGSRLRKSRNAPDGELSESASHSHTFTCRAMP